MVKNPYKPKKKFYDFTRMTDKEIEMELASVRREVEVIAHSNVIKFPEKG